MPNLAVIATIEVPAGYREEAVAALVAHRERCLRDEPDTLQFEIMVVRDEPSRIMLYEVYANQAGFDRHWNGASLAQLHHETGGRIKITSGTWGTPMPDSAK